MSETQTTNSANDGNKKTSFLYNANKLIIALAVLLLIIVIPFLYNLLFPSPQHDPSIDTPMINKMAKKECVEPKDYMKHNHMVLLNEWHDEVVRKGDRFYGEIEGVMYEKSLQNTCLHCHSNKEEFCDRCHSYANVQVYCWQCHIEPKERMQ